MEFPDGEVRHGKRHLVCYVVTGRATPRCPGRNGLTLSDSEEDEALIQPEEDNQYTTSHSYKSHVTHQKKNLNLMRNFNFA